MKAVDVTVCSFWCNNKFGSCLFSWWTPFDYQYNRQPNWLVHKKSPSVKQVIEDDRQAQEVRFELQYREAVTSWRIWEGLEDSAILTGSLQSSRDLKPPEVNKRDKDKELKSWHLRTIAFFLWSILQVSLFHLRSRHDYKRPMQFHGHPSPKCSDSRALNRLWGNRASGEEPPNQSAIAEVEAARKRRRGDIQWHFMVCFWTCS